MKSFIKPFKNAMPQKQKELNYYWLNQFVQEARVVRRIKRSDYLLRLIIAYSKIKIPCRFNYEKNRRTYPAWRHDAKGYSVPCYACGEKFEQKDIGRLLVFHHIILIKNGGLDIKKNRIFLCKSCHSKVHDWIENDDKRYNGIEEYVSA